MKHAILILAVTMLFAGPAAAISGSLGGIIYWDTKVVGAGGQDIRLWSGTIGVDWTMGGTGTNFDNINFSDINTYGWQQVYCVSQVEVIDPRDQGGQGRLVRASIYVDDSWRNNTDYTQPWHIVTLDGDGSNKAQISIGGNALSVNPKHLLPVPEGFVPNLPGNGLNFYWRDASNKFYYMHDANGNGVIDNTTTEMTYKGYAWGYADDSYDLEYSAPERAMYMTNFGDADLGGANFHYVGRVWFNESGVQKKTMYFRMGGVSTNPWGNAADGRGLAVGVAATGSAPIVYLFGRDNDTGLDTIFALRDGDGDNVVTLGDADDTVAIVWQRNQFGLTRLHSTNINGYGEDLEYYKDPSPGGKQYLIGNGYSGYLFVLELADNGLVAVGGQYLYGNGQYPLGQYSGFELDMNPVVIPEPATLLLVGTGVLGVLGYIRRRRMP